MTLLSRSSSPAVWLLRDLERSRAPPAGPHGRSADDVTEEEVKAMVEEGTDAGVFEGEERHMIDGVLRLADRPVRRMMTPRLEIVWLDGGDDRAGPRSASRTAATPASRSASATIDTIEGVVHTKDILDAVLRGEPLDIAPAMRDR